MFVATTRRSPEGSTRNGQGLQSPINKMFSEVDWWWPGERDIAMGWMPAVELTEGPDEYRIVVELPGVNPEHVTVSVEHGTITIQGEKRLNRSDSDRVHRAERHSGRFHRTFAVAAAVDAERITADYDAGLLTVTLPKSERARPRQIPIRTS